MDITITKTRIRGLSIIYIMQEDTEVPQVVADTEFYLNDTDVFTTKQIPVDLTNDLQTLAMSIRDSVQSVEDSQVQNSIDTSVAKISVKPIS